MRQSNEYLYGTNDVPEVPKCVCQARLDLIEKQITIVLDQPTMDRDSGKLNYLIKARTFWTDMRDHNGGY